MATTTKSQSKSKPNAGEVVHTAGRWLVIYSPTPDSGGEDWIVVEAGDEDAIMEASETKREAVAAAEALAKEDAEAAAENARAEAEEARDERLALLRDRLYEAAADCEDEAKLAAAQALLTK